MDILEAIVATADRLKQGDLKARTQIPHDGSELGRLAQAVDQMADEMQARHRHIEQITGQARRASRAHRTLSASNRALVRATDETSHLQEVCRLIVDVGGYPCAWVGYVQHKAEEILCPVAFSGTDRNFFAALPLAGDGQSPLCGLCGTAIKTGQPVVIENVASDPSAAAWRDAALARGFNSALALPLHVDGEIMGVLCVYAVELANFDSEEIKLLAEAAEDLAFGIASLRTRQRQQEAEEAFHRVSRQNTLILESAAEGIFGVDVNGVINFVNPAGSAMLGYEQDELLGRDSHATLHSCRADGSPYPVDDCPVHSALAAGIMIHCMEETFWRKDGSSMPVEISSRPVVENGKLVGAVVTLMNISERKRYLVQLERQSNYDEFTGLPNRNLLNDRLNHAIERCRLEDLTLAVLTINLNHFGIIVDSLGLRAGDQVLQMVAERLREFAREADTLARRVGDEFVLVMEAVQVETVAEVAQAILERLSQPLVMEEREIFLTASIGISVFPKDGSHGEMLLRNATAAMFRAKKTGDKHFRFYTAEMNALSLERLDMENALRHAMERNELVLHYQPQLNLRTGEIIGAEALLRWQHPQHGLVMPGDFIPLAEATGLIVPLGKWVLRTACAQNKAWQDAGLPAISMAVNMSAQQFDTQDVVELVIAVLEETGLDPKCMELELTEGVIMANAAEFILASEKLKGLAITLSIDDFGTGYSSLSYLTRFALDRLKIDQSFIRDITHDASAAAIVQAVIGLSQSLKLSVIAEGVETEAQLNFLRTMGCDEMQGFYFSKPLPAGEFEQLLHERRRLTFSSRLDAPGNTLLLVDDEPSILAALKRILRREGYTVLTAGSGHEGLEQLANHPVGVVVSDSRMPAMSGNEFLDKVREIHPETVRIMLSGYTDLQAVTDAVNQGELYKFLTKPWEDEDLLKIIRDAFRHYETRRRRYAKGYEYGRER